MSCTPNPAPPEGYRVWRGAVPQPIVDWAVYLRDLELPRAAYGATWGMTYTHPSGTSEDVIARKDHHPYTYKNGRLITGICIPGITVYKSLLSQAVGVSLDTSDLSTPDPNAALYSVDTDTAGNPLPIDQETAPDTGLLVGTAVAFAAVVGLFVAAIRSKIR